MNKLSILFFLSLLLMGCASPYKPEGFMGGYSEIQLDKNIFQISFRGNGYTSPEKAANLALLRSADVTLQNGYTYFIIVNSTESSKYSTYTTPTTVETNGNPYYGNSMTTIHNGQTYTIAKPQATNTIICFKQKPKKVNGLIYNAENVSNSLSRYK